jgi:hypothetical protein
MAPLRADENLDATCVLNEASADEREEGRGKREEGRGKRKGRKSRTRQQSRVEFPHSFLLSATRFLPDQPVQEDHIQRPSLSTKFPSVEGMREGKGEDVRVDRLAKTRIGSFLHNRKEPGVSEVYMSEGTGGLRNEMRSSAYESFIEPFEGHGSWEAGSERSFDFSVRDEARLPALIFPLSMHWSWIHWYVQNPQAEQSLSLPLNPQSIHRELISRPRRLFLTFGGRSKFLASDHHHLITRFSSSTSRPLPLPSLCLNRTASAPSRRLSLLPSLFLFLHAACIVLRRRRLDPSLQSQKPFPFVFVSPVALHASI